MLDEAAIDHVHDSGDRDRGLGDVGRHDDLARVGRRRLEHLHLLLDRQAGEHGHHEQRRPSASGASLLGLVPHKLLGLLLRHGTHGLDLLLAGHEDEHVAAGHVAMNVEDRAHGALHVVGGRLLEVVHLDREALARERDQCRRVVLGRSRPAVIVVKVSKELLGIERRRRHDQAKVLALLLNPAAERVSITITAAPVVGWLVRSLVRSLVRTF